MKEIIRGVLVAGVCTIALFLFHYAFPSTINNHNTIISLAPGRLDDKNISNVVLLHLLWSVFAVRPMTTFFILGTDFFLGLGYGWSFVLVNFGLFFLDGVLLYFLSLRLTGKRAYAALSVVMFYLSFTIALAFFGSIDSYDEPFQYLWIFATFLLFGQKKWLFAALSLAAACIARETTFFLFPAIYLFILPKNLDIIPRLRFLGPRIRRAVPLFVSLAIYLIFIILYFSFAGLWRGNEQYLKQDRFRHILFNFRSFQFGLESIVSIVLALGIPATFLLMFKKTQKSGRSAVAAAKAFWLTVALNTPIVLFTAIAREARILALPLVFVWPHLGQYVAGVAGWFRHSFLRLRLRTFFILVAIFFLLSFILTKIIFLYYHPTDSGNFDAGYRFFLLITAILPVLFVLFRWVSRWLDNEQ